eukprot:jgi/Mesvir1/14433/Mv05163-RA.1
MEIEGGSATPATAAEESAVTHAYFLPCRGRPGRVAISSRWSWQEIRRFLPAPELCEILKPALTQPSDRAIGVYASKKGANAVNATASRILEWAVTGDVLLLKTRDRDDLPTAVLDITADDVYIMHDFAKDAWVRVLCREPSVKTPAPTTMAFPIMNQTNEVPMTKTTMCVPSDRRRTDPRPVYESPLFLAGLAAVLVGGFFVYRRYASGGGAGAFAGGEAGGEGFAAANNLIS